MAQITSRGKLWEYRNSIWMLWAILTLGFFNYISFFYTSYRVKQKKWFIAGIIYAILFFMMVVITEIVNRDHWLYDLFFALYLLGWIASIIHVFKMRPEYLLRLEAKVTFGREKELESMKQMIAREYGKTNDSRQVEKPKVATIKSLQQISLEEAEKDEEIGSEVVHTIDLNTATEEEIANVPGIGSLFAKKIITVRNQEKGFKSFEHFVEILSVKPHLIEKIKPYFSFSDQPNPEQTNKMEGRIVDF
ncbi:ComEA family DNA-binding protein [Lederbergia lenta]|uniref:Putative integral inner membrane protein n=1 Tax=Lederbergia lenta TaxID=1467 RepID=A0A2X4WKS0_LEDLE|nr:helix-hairpin-helix domain-containing protein [Lederbergia lenta]MCM3112890.1 helix-hairpin-helix domain-containing protein [Lederbergia lenta]MEC2326143.1 helix-hairpin-helix domain-containing protein [Lederbergia lenta]SQI63523.1 putative integral inner membrane protein [Lederbergia lenta]